MRGIKREFSPKYLSLKLNAKAWGLTVHFKQLCMLIFCAVWLETNGLTATEGELAYAIHQSKLRVVAYLASALAKAVFLSMQ